MKPDPGSSLRPLPRLLLLPFLVVLALTWLIPLAEGILMSLRANVLFGEGRFIGLGHYIDLASDRRFFKALFNTFSYAALCIAVIVPFALAAAQLLRMVWPAWRGIFGFCLLLPGLTPPVVLGFLFLLVFSGKYGLLNAILAEPWGLPAIDWIKDPAFIKASLVMQALWRWGGFLTLFLLAGMEGIPKTLYDTARAEGAQGWGLFRHVTLPMLSHILLFSCIFLFLDAFVLFSGAYVLLGGSGGTSDAGLLLLTYIYQTAFTYGRFGSAAAMGFTIVPILVMLLWMAMTKGPSASKLHGYAV